MRLHMRAVDHNALGIAALVRQRCENLVEHPHIRIDDVYASPLPG
jgi:hypothetical protein